MSQGIVQITIQSIRNSFSRKLMCLTLPTIADLIPSEPFPRDIIEFPTNVKFLKLLK